MAKLFCHISIKPLESVIRFNIEIHFINRKKNHSSNSTRGITILNGYIWIMSSQNFKSIFSHFKVTARKNKQQLKNYATESNGKFTASNLVIKIWSHLALT